MRRHWAKVGLKIVALVAIAGAAFGLLVMSLWNWLLPSLFGWPAIGFWQAVGLMVLSRILLGGFRGGMGGHAPWRHRMRERWEGMTPEERERFREGLRSRCGHRPASDDSAAPSAQGPAGA